MVARQSGGWGLLPGARCPTTGAWSALSVRSSSIPDYSILKSKSDTTTGVSDLHEGKIVLEPRSLQPWLFAFLSTDRGVRGFLLRLSSFESKIHNSPLTDFLCSIY